MVVYNGETTNFTGQGTVNPQKLVIPRKNEMDQASQAAMLKIEQWLNALSVPPSGFTQISHTYAVSGTIVVPTGATGYLPPFFMPTSCLLLGVMTEVRAGSLVLTIEQNGGSIATGVPAGTSPTFTAIPHSVAANDSFQPVVTAVTGADGLSCAFYFAT